MVSRRKMNDIRRSKVEEYSPVNTPANGHTLARLVAGESRPFPFFKLLHYLIAGTRAGAAVDHTRVHYVTKLLITLEETTGGLICRDVDGLADNEVGTLLGNRSGHEAYG